MTFDKTKVVFSTRRGCQNETEKDITLKV